MVGRPVRVADLVLGLVLGFLASGGAANADRLGEDLLLSEARKVQDASTELPRIEARALSPACTRCSIKIELQSAAGTRTVSRIEHRRRDGCDQIQSNVAGRPRAVQDGPRSVNAELGPSCWHFDGSLCSE